MLVKLFVLGRSGCGKSTVARYLEQLARDAQWLPVRINDYEILRAMFQEDAKKVGQDRWFVTSEFGGFNLLNFGAFDVALQQLEQQAAEEFVFSEKATTKPLFALIEFARNDYQRAFQQFSREFLQDAYFLYLDASVATCKQRIRERIAKPLPERTEDDFFVSDYMFDAYFDHDDGKSLPAILENDFGISKQRAMVLDNNAELEVVAHDIAAFVQYIIEGTECSHPEKDQSCLAKAVLS